MNFKYLVAGIKNILFNPDKAWDNIEAEEKQVRTIRDSILLPVIILVSLAALAGSLMFSNSALPASYSFFVAVRTFLILITTVYVAALIMGEITFPLDLGRDFNTSFTIITFSFIPFFICSILSGLFESLLFVNIIGLYGLYIFWEGTGKFMNPPRYKRMPLLIATFAITVLVYLGADAVLKTVLDKIFYAFFD